VTKGLVLDLAADVGSKRALELERKALESNNEELRQKAIRALADWSNASASGDLLKLAKGAKANRDRLLALRGYIRIAGMDGAGISSAERTAVFRQADSLATRPEEKRLIAGNLRNAGTPEALKMLIGYMKDKSLKQEAELSAADLIWNLRLLRSEEVMKLAEELTGSSNKAVAQKARASLADMNKANAYLRNWSYAGPFQEKNKDGRAIFKTVFPPEKPGLAGVPWSPLQKGISNEFIDLLQAIRNMNNCCVYVQTRIVSDKDHQVRLEMGSDDGIRAWVNGTLVHSNYQERACTPGQDIARINLKKGENIILLKIVQQSGGWAFSCRLMNNNGTAVKGLKVLAN